MRRANQQVALLALVAGFALGCTSSAETVDAGPQPMRLPVAIATDEGDVTFQAEIADTPDERQKGLMFREQMEDEHGMLFLFPDERQRSFWMKNTYIPLDMIFIRADRTILGIVENAEPRTMNSRSVPGASQFVLEINGGLAKQRGLAAGQEVRFIAPLPTR